MQFAALLPLLSGVGETSLAPAEYPATVCTSSPAPTILPMPLFRHCFLHVGTTLPYNVKLTLDKAPERVDAMQLMFHRRCLAVAIDYQESLWGIYCEVHSELGRV